MVASIEGPEVFFVLIIWLGLFGGIGYWIGSQKDRGAAGFVLGFLIGPIGWIVAAVLPGSVDWEADRQQVVRTGSGPPPGWYKDPDGGKNDRWWDGSRWTEHEQRR